MAGFLSLFNTPERVEVANGYWVELKTSLTTEDYEAAQRVLLGKMSLVAGGELRSEPDTIAYQQEIVARAIVNWNLTDEHGHDLPLAPEEAKLASIRRLPQSVFLALYEKASDSTAPRSSEEELKFRPDGESRLVGNGQAEAPNTPKISD
jgi:hypothetical protein